MNASKLRQSTKMSREPNVQTEGAGADQVRQLYFSIVCDQSLPNEGCAFGPSSSEQARRLNRITAAWPKLSPGIQDSLLNFAENIKSSPEASIEPNARTHVSTHSSFGWTRSKASVKRNRDK